MNVDKAEFFNSQADEPWASSEFSPSERLAIERMLSMAQLTEGMRVIEPGCGTGRLTSILADLVGPTGLVLASDISPKMIDAAFRRLGPRDHVALKHLAIESFRFDAESFDAVVCHNVFPHFDDKPATVNHLAAALRPAGRFIVFHFMNSAGINDLHRKAHPSVLNDLLPPENEMREIFRASGLHIEQLSDDGRGYFLAAIRS